jgi:hypothetical protein
MENEIIKLKKENKLLKEKIKKKSLNLKKANVKIKEYTKLNIDRYIFSHKSWLERLLYDELTNHIDKGIYRIEYIYKGKQYTARKISSFGSRWLSHSLAIHLANENDLIIYPGEIEIINAERLW